MTRHPLSWRIARAVAYLAFAAAGLAVLTWPPVSYSGVSTWLTITWGLLLLGPGLAAAGGVLLRRYAWEWVASWLLAAGLSIYALLSWGTVVDSLGNAPRALILTAAATMFVARGIQMGLEDRRARLAVLATREVRSGPLA